MTGMRRREFLVGASSCAAHLALLGAVAPTGRWPWHRVTQNPVVAREAFGYLERVADGAWALVSTPLGGDRATLANGGLVAGRDGVLAIEGFFQPAGARWLAERSRELTGRWPTHVAVTHYHADHANGLAGYATPGGSPVVRATAVTRDLVLERNRTADPASLDALRAAEPVLPEAATELDLGGRVVRVLPHDGHTPSDLALVLDEPRIVFCGDLVWHGMFPNYVDARPARLRAAVAALPGDPGTTYVPGHGPVGRAPEFGRYVAVLDEVEQAARKAHAAGMPAAEAGAAFTLSPGLGEWTLFGPTFFERAFTAWYRELDGD
jgi:glyoxylase-like metal-dependent hydrolase (beta-lactamase superfamily II)